jgi:hypothetical protein
LHFIPRYLAALLRGSSFVSFGVLDHIYDPMPTVNAAFHALRQGGKMSIWVYGYEGNELYLSVFAPVRHITKLLPHSIPAFVCKLLCFVADGYGFACRFLPLPLLRYFLNHFMKLARDERELTIYDQLRPVYAKYYSKKEALDLLSSAGFVNVETYHRHNYSWTVIGEKPS